MKKFLYLSIFFFSFILLGLSRVNASELVINSLGYSSCLDQDNNLVLSCNISNVDGSLVFTTTSNSRVSNYFLVSDSFDVYQEGSQSNSYKFCFYRQDYSFIECLSLNLTDEITTITSPADSYYCRAKLFTVRLVYIDDDLNQVSSLNSAINSLTDTVIKTYSDFTWVFLLAFSIVVVGFIIALILRVGK